MNAGPKEAEEILNGLKSELGSIPSDVDSVCCPPFISMAVAAAHTSFIPFGAQDVHYEDNGAYTGAISTQMLTEIGASYCIIGHSERREYFGETDEMVNRKAKKLLSADICPIICCGETLDQRKNTDYEGFVAGQIKAAFSELSAEQAKACVIAYEPIWAIGTGETASPEQAQAMHAHLRATLKQMYDADTAESIRILYGGSMKAANAVELLSQTDVDGGLVGGASLKPAEFAAIIKAAAN